MQCTKYLYTSDTQKKIVLPAFFLVGWSNMVNSGQWLESRSNIDNFWASAFNYQENTLEPSFLSWWFQLLRWWPGSLNSVEQSPLATCDGWATELRNPCFSHWNVQSNDTSFSSISCKRRCKFHHVLLWPLPWGSDVLVHGCSVSLSPKVAWYVNRAMKDEQRTCNTSKK